MRPFYSALILSFAALLSGCASVVDGSMQSVRVDTPGAYDAECTLNNGVKYTTRTGETFDIQRSRRDLLVDCYAPGNRHKRIIVKSDVSDWEAGNVANGIVPGVAYDLVSGATFEYPSVITVDFVGVPTLGFELPEYHNKDAQNPYKESIEGYGATTPSIPEDSVYMKRGWQKRDSSTDSNPFATTTAKPVGMTGEPSAKTSTATTSTPVMTPSKPNISGKTAEELNRSANPTVFNK